MKIRRVLAAALLACACAQPAERAEAQSVEGSRFASAPSAQWRLPNRLREISGLAVAPDGRLFGHDDETAVIYEIDPQQGRLVKAFALGDPVETGDFEGLAITPNGDFWLTTSRGRLFRFREADDGTHVEYETFDTALDDICEIEGLAYSASEESLILACKQNKARDMRDTISLYAWRIGGDGEAHAWRTLAEADLANAAGVEDFRPSSLDIDAQGRMVLLSARDGALAEFDPAGALVSARALAPSHRQAEGAAALPGGDLVVADEAGNDRALLSRYPAAR